MMELEWIYSLEVTYFWDCISSATELVPKVIYYLSWKEQSACGKHVQEFRSEY